MGFCSLNIDDLTPNVGLSWYFFTEMFDHFRPFFTMVFQVRLCTPFLHLRVYSLCSFRGRRCQLHVAIYVAPLAIAFKKEPLYAVVCMQSVTAMLKSYPTLGDSGLALAMLPLYPEVIPRTSLSLRSFSEL